MVADMVLWRWDLCGDGAEDSIVPVKQSTCIVLEAVPLLSLSWHHRGRPVLAHSHLLCCWIRNS